VPSDSQSGSDDDDFIDRWADPETIFGDPETRFGDPEQPDLIPDIAPDTTETEAAEPTLATDFSDVDSDVLNSFVVILLLIKVGILLISAGILLIAFRSLIELGGGVIAIGLLAFVRAGQHYWSHTQTADDEPAANDDERTGDMSTDGPDGDTSENDTVESNATDSNTPGHNG